MRYRPHLRYLLRVVLLVAPLLALWWSVLLGPLQGALRFSTEMVFRACLPADPPAMILAAPDGNWLFRVPVPAAIARRDEIQKLFGRVSPASPPVKVRSMRLAIPGEDASLFLVSLPFFWAIVSAAGWTRRTWRALAAGTAILLLTAVVLMAFDVVRAFVVTTQLVASAPGTSLLQSADFAVRNVIPYLAPVLLALLLDAHLRSLIFSGQPLAEAPPAPAPAPRQRRAAGAARPWPKAAARRSPMGSPR